MQACSSGAFSSYGTLWTRFRLVRRWATIPFRGEVKTEFAGFNAAVVLRRNFGIFILKSLVPLFLLVLVVFATLFFPETLFRERITLPVTAILTSAVCFSR